MPVVFSPNETTNRSEGDKEVHLLHRFVMLLAPVETQKKSKIINLLTCTDIILTLLLFLLSWRFPCLKDVPLKLAFQQKADSPFTLSKQLTATLILYFG